MRKLFGFVGATVGGWVGWYLGAWGGFFLAFIFSMIATGFGMYYGYRFAARFS